MCSGGKKVKQPVHDLLDRNEKKTTSEPKETRLGEGRRRGDLVRERGRHARGPRRDRKEEEYSCRKRGTAGGSQSSCEPQKDGPFSVKTSTQKKKIGLYQKQKREKRDLVGISE